MKNLNIAQVIGNLTRDPELKTTKGGTEVCSFSIATSRKWTSKDGDKKEEVEYHNCIAWGKLATIVADYARKGEPVYVSGHLNTQSWEKDGHKNYRTEIVVDDFILLGQKRDGASKPSRGDDREPEDTQVDF